MSREGQTALSRGVGIAVSGLVSGGEGPKVLQVHITARGGRRGAGNTLGEKAIFSVVI